MNAENMYDAWDNGDRHEIRQQLAKRNKKDMTDKELMQQALEALEADEHDMAPDQEGHMVFRREAAITALRERLAQPEQEPVAELREYIEQREWVGLTEGERVAIAEACGAMDAGWLVFVEAVERALKEKNNG
jgi:hypothetical protein